MASRTSHECRKSPLCVGVRKQGAEAFAGGLEDDRDLLAPDQLRLELKRIESQRILGTEGYPPDGPSSTTGICRKPPSYMRCSAWPKGRSDEMVCGSVVMISSTVTIAGSWPVATTPKTMSRSVQMPSSRLARMVTSTALVVALHEFGHPTDVSVG